MVSVVFANLVSFRLFGRSLFDVQLRNRGFDLTLGRGSAILTERRVGELVHEDFVRFAADDKISKVRSELAKSGRSEGVVLGSEGSLSRHHSGYRLALPTSQTDSRHRRVG